MPFTLGQHWISNTESELGLGTVVALDARVVTLLFPTIGENRLYSHNDSPITRVMLSPGGTITNHEGWQLHVDKVNEESGLLSYTGTRLDTQEANVTLREVLLDSRLAFSKPQSRLFAGQIDRMDRFALHCRTCEFQSKQYRMPWSGLCDQHASLAPHRPNIAHDVGHRYASHIPLADEASLGKTIEAGMILRQQLPSDAVERILIVVPETLQYQWLVGMLRRFNLRFLLFDDERYAEAQHGTYNPFETKQLVICSLDFVRRSKQRLEHLCDAEQGLMAVDEAHRLVWSEEAPSHECQAIGQLAEHMPDILLLIATPEQLGMESHFARLRPLDPNRFYDFAQFVEEQQNYRPVADAVTLLLAGNTLSDSEFNTLGDLIDEWDIEPLLQAANSDREDARAARQELVSMLMDRHGTSRVLFRNTRNGVRGSPKRELHTVRLPLPTQYRTTVKVSGIIDTRETVEEHARDMLYPEQVYQEFEGDTDTWWNSDPHIEWLIGYLASHRSQRVPVICAKATTALQLEQVPREHEGVRVVVLHEGISIIERDRATAWFAGKNIGAQVLLYSEIDSERCNFQFASSLIMFDLPSNPDLLGQRIGRLDHIGRAHNIQIHVPCLEKTAQSVLMR